MTIQKRGLKNAVDEAFLDTQHIKKLRQNLSFYIKLYSKKFNIESDFQKSILYDKYGISSITKLTEKQLEKEIESYKTSINNNIV